jgi:hypothetical protein
VEVIMIDILPWLSLLLSWASLFLAIAAAIFWARSARVHVPDLPDTALTGPNSVAGLMRKQSGLNANAALCAAASVIAQILVRVVAA